MLKEVFVIQSGTLLFHYSHEKSTLYSDQAILSGGLLSAIDSFVKGTKDNVIDSFLTDQESYLFKKVEDDRKVIVGVFDRKDSYQLTQEAMKKIKEVMSQSKVILDDFTETDHPEMLDLGNKIRILMKQIFGVEGEEIRIKEMLEKRTDIQIGILIDIIDKREIGHFARPSPLFKIEQCNNALLLYSNLLQVLSRLNIAKSFNYFTISSKDYVIAGFLSGRNYSITTGVIQTPEPEVIQVAANMCHLESVEGFILTERQPRIHNSSILDNNGNIDHQEGEQLPTMAGIFLSTLVNIAGKLFKSLTRKNFINFKLVSKEEESIEFKINRQGKSDDFRISIVHYS